MPFVGAVYLLAFLSGSSALIYEVAWTKQLALTFGRSTLAASAVLGGFMAGMGFGAWLCHRGLRASRDPLRVYVLLELGIGTSAGLLSVGFSVLPDVFPRLAAQIPSGVALDL